MADRIIDLHTHSDRSDGSMTPTQLVEHAAQNGISAIALSDHDTVAGVSQAVAAGKKYGVEVVPAIEFSVKSDTETHILGYYIDVENPDLLGVLDEIVRVRIERNEGTCERLRALGFDVSVEEAAALAPGGIIGRAHFARVLVNKGYAESVKQAFADYLSAGKPAFFNNQTLTAERAVEVIRKSGGVAFLAHPHLIKISDSELEKLLIRLRDCGLSGLEGYYTDYDEKMQEKFQAMAQRLGLEISGGTDFHAAMKPHISIGRGTGNMAIPYSVLERIKTLANVN